MPQRFLKPGITTSTAWNAVNWQAQSFYVRLLTLVDDYGRYDARWQILRSYAFPLHEEITHKQMLALCEQLHTNGLAVFYRVDGKEFVQLTKWREKARTDSRFPELNDSCEQMFANVVKCSLPSPSPSPSPSPCDPLRGVALEVLQYLNEKAKRKFRDEDKTLAPLLALLKQGREAALCKQVIDFKVKEWLGTDQEKFLRPSTLFRESNFLNYAEAVESGQRPKSNGSKSRYAPVIVQPADAKPY